MEGVPGRVAFDRILVTAAAETVPQALIGQLASDGGIMLLPLGPHDGAQRIVRLTKTKDGVAQEDLIAVRFVPLLPGRAREL
jgi:protein-L-isoaspartate(D-aspartate) O-methyltransferase